MSRSSSASHEPQSSQGETTSKPVERGHLYFLYRPKVDVEEAHLTKDVQRFYLWMAPERVEMADHVTHPIGAQAAATASSIRTRHSQTKAAPVEGSGGLKPLHRLLVVPTKRLPDASNRRPIWAFVEEAADTVDKIKSHIGEFHYHTQTRGDRTTQAARIVAEAIYEIIHDPDSRHTYLFYELELPVEAEEPQKAFHIQKEGLILVQAKNPHAGDTNREGVRVAGLQSKGKPHYPKHLQEAFAGIRVPETKFTALVPEMLNFPGTELLLLGVKHSPREVIGAEELQRLQQAAEQEEQQAGSSKEEEQKKIEQETGVKQTALHQLY